MQQCGNVKGYNLSEAGKILGVHKATVMRWIRNGKLKAKRKGSRWMIPVSSIREFISKM
jgi:excisionase family DNA binding protein